MFGSDVQANQNNPIGKIIAPIIIGGSLSSGIGLPCLTKDLLKLVAVEYAMTPFPSKFLRRRKEKEGSQHLHSSHGPLGR
jgi:hypothetical protein